MNQALHLAFKDLRRYRPLVLLAVLSLLLSPVATYFGLAVGKFGPIPGSFLVEVVKWPLILLLALAVMQDDSPIGFRSFWLTRPIRPGALLAAKLLLLTALFTVPAALAAGALAGVIDAGTAVSFAVALEVALTIQVALVAAALLGALCRTVVETGRTVFLLLLAWWAGALLIPTFLPGRSLLPAAQPGITVGSQMVSGMIVYLLLGTGILVWFYRARRVVPAATLSLLALPLSVVAGRLTPFQLAPQATSTVVATAPADSEFPSPTITVSSTGVIDGTHVALRPGQGRFRQEYVAVDAKAVVPSGGQLIEVNAVATELTQRDGTVQRYPLVTVRTILGWDALQNSIRRGFGAAPHPPPAPSHFKLRLFSVPEGDNPAPPGSPARLRARLHLSHSKYSIESRMPLREGVTARLGGELWRIDEVELQPDGKLHLQVRRMQATSLLRPVGKARPDQLGPATGHIRALVLYNEKRSEHAIALDAAGSRLDFAMITRQELVRRPFDRKFDATGRSSQHFDADWIADAELLILNSHVVGKTVAEIALDDFVLVRE